MKTQFKKLTVLTAGIFFLLAGVLHAQTSYQSSTAETTISGTSTLHDWSMTAANGQVKATFTFNGDQVSGITALTFSVAAESLKSDKSGLDRNAYRALKTSEHPNITFTMTSGTVTSTGKNTFQIKATGNLNISGTSKQTTLVATGQLNPADKSITAKGSTKFKMTEYKVTPPTVMMGTIKTGDEITIDYNVKLTNK